MNITLTNTSIFTDETVQKAIDRLMNSPILDFICTVSDEKWKGFQKEFFDYYYKNMWNEFGKNNYEKKNLKKDLEALEKKAEKCLYDENTDVKDYLDYCKMYDDVKKKYEETDLYRLVERIADKYTSSDDKDKYTSKNKNNWCFLGKEEYQKEINDAMSEDSKEIER